MQQQILILKKTRWYLLTQTHRFGFVTMQLQVTFLNTSLCSLVILSLWFILSAQQNGIDSPTLMGNVNLHLRDNEGNKHEFNLTKVNYMPNSPVNLHSLQWLAEQYPNKNGTPDQNGTGIDSSYDSHMLYRNKKQFSKTFPTADLGLPECLFNSGYTQISVFTLHLAWFYNDRIHWVFASKVKDTDLASDDNGGVIVTVDSEGGVSFALLATVDNAVFFMRGMKLWYNDGNGTCDIVTFLDIDYIDDIQIFRWFASFNGQMTLNFW